MKNVSRTVATLTVLIGISHPLLAADGFSLEDDPGQSLVVLMGANPVARYMYAHDTSTKKLRHDTYKPYLHVYDASGRNLITKGAGGELSHHRGIFIGWNRIGFNGKRYDRWHMNDGEIVHREFARKTANKGGAMFTSVTEWYDENGNPMLEEQRTMGFSPGGDAGRLIIDFQSTLKAIAGDVDLKGDPEHAGIQYRPSDQLDRQQTLHVFPKKDADPRKDLDYPWVGETYSIKGGSRHSVVHMNHPDNPKGTKYSAYRNYGRFGAFFEQKIPDGESLTVKYRFLIADGEMPPAKMIQRVWDEFAGAPSASPTPKISAIKAK